MKVLKMIEDLVDLEALIKINKIIMENIKINFGQLRSLEKSLEEDNMNISRKALESMIHIIIESPRNEIKNTIAYKTLLDLDIISDNSSTQQLNS